MAVGSLLKKDRNVPEGLESLLFHSLTLLHPSESRCVGVEGPPTVTVSEEGGTP